MPNSLPELETLRTDLFRQLAALGDFRSGSITTTSGKCGKFRYFALLPPFYGSPEPKRFSPGLDDVCMIGNSVQQRLT